METDDRNEKIIVCGVEITKAEWDEVKDYPYKLPRKVALHIIKEWDERRAEEKRAKLNIRPDKWEGASVIVDPLRRTAVKIDQLMPKYLNYGSFCKMASQHILECVNWMRIVRDCATRCNEAKANLQQGMMTQSIIDFFTHLKKESAHAMKMYQKTRFDMRVYVYIFNVINDYYKERLIRNRYLVKNDIILDIFQDRKLEWYNNYRTGNNVTFFENECREQDNYEQDFLDAIKKYNEICNVPEDVHFTLEEGRYTRCQTSGDIDIEFIPEYINWFSRIDKKTKEDILNQFYFITSHYKPGFVKIKIHQDENGKFRFKFWANTPYYKQYNYNNDDWDEPFLVKDNVKNEIKEEYVSEPVDMSGELTFSSSIYNKQNIYGRNESYTYYLPNFNVDSISYISSEYLEEVGHNPTYVFPPPLYEHESPPGTVDSDKPPDNIINNIKRYIKDRSILI